MRPYRCGLEAGRTVGETEKPEENFAVTVRGYAGFAAAVLGSVYVYGALIKATQFHGANQSVTDTLPLVPLEQVLLAGINASLLLIVVAIFGALVILAIREMRERRGSDAPKKEREAPKKREEKDRTWMERHFLHVLWVFAAAGWLFLLMVSPLSMLVTFIYFAVFLWWRWPPLIPRGRWLIVLAVLFVCVTLAQNFFNPKPLPEVKLTTSDGRVVEGDLLVNTNSTWYVGTGDHKFEAVEAADVESALVETQDRKDEKSVFEELTGGKLFGLPNR
jgi:membrane protein implicated in regulation of membrane protease activity